MDHCKSLHLVFGLVQLFTNIETENLMLLSEITTLMLKFRVDGLCFVIHNFQIPSISCSIYFPLFVSSNYLEKNTLSESLV